MGKTAINRAFTKGMIIVSSVLLFSVPLHASEKCMVRFVAEGQGAGAGMSPQTRLTTAKKQGKRNAYRMLTQQIGRFLLNRDTSVSSAARRNYNFRRGIQRKIRSATILHEGFDKDEKFNVKLEVCMVFPAAADRSLCAPVGSTCEGLREEEERSAEKEEKEESENFLTRLAHQLTDPVLSPEQNPEANFENYSVVAAEDRLLTEQKDESSGYTLIRDGVDMTLVEAVKKDQQNAPALFRMAVLGGTDREVALASVLMGMIKPTSEELSNVINQGIALGVTRGEVDRAVDRVQQACEVCKELENPASAPIGEIESGPVQQ